ncbi:hypothetical protein FAEPRAA2165_00511 [Faecalibacterium duncaniae]|uniref:Uncharacterized protein n=1 Tax=Faecalibacterium duncaniae (strain DSM 17677 / JCM 31915 / A2-165) TaxID=411483 RepID=C7H2L3_FAED2|nr:hypothetical protein FAEPRAA2165_00511 [Faecalibacterium duncaniae]
MFSLQLPGVHSRTGPHAALSCCRALWSVRNALLFPILAFQ